jgi:hypothetical protein
MQKRLCSAFLILLLLVPLEFSASASPDYRLTNFSLYIKYTDGEIYRAVLVENESAYSIPIPSPDNREALYRWRFTVHNFLVLDRNGKVVEDSNKYFEISRAAFSLLSFEASDSLTSRASLFREIAGLSEQLDILQLIGNVLGHAVGVLSKWYLTARTLTGGTKLAEEAMRKSLDMTIDKVADYMLVAGSKAGLRSIFTYAMRLQLEDAADRLERAATFMKRIENSILRGESIIIEFNDIKNYIDDSEEGESLGFSAMTGLQKAYQKGVAGYLEGVVKNIIKSMDPTPITTFYFTLMDDMKNMADLREVMRLMSARRAEYILADEVLREKVRDWQAVFLKNPPSAGSVEPKYEILIGSHSTDGNENIGSVYINGTSLTLPVAIMRKKGVFSIAAVSPRGYRFLRWECGGMVKLGDSTMQTTSVTVEGDGWISAVFEVVPSPSGNGSDIVFTLDISGSMNDVWDGKKKIDSAKDSAIALLRSLSTNDRVSIVSFESTAHLDLPLTQDKSRAIDVIKGLSAGGSTNIGDAIVKALEELKRNGRGSQMAIILFTDGMITTGMSREEIMNGPVQEAISMGVRIYTIGYGNPNELDDVFLRRLAESTGGKYCYSSDAYQLENDFVETGQVASGWKLLLSFLGKVKEGETSAAGFLYVPAGLSALKVILNWRGSILDLKVVYPNGTIVEASDTSEKPKYITVYNPPPGNYTILVYGRDVHGEEYYKAWTMAILGPLNIIPPAGGGGASSGQVQGPSEVQIQRYSGVEDYFWILLISLIVASAMISISLYYSRRPSYYLIDKSGRVLLRCSKRDRVYGREDFIGILNENMLKYISRREKGGQFRIFKQGKYYYIVDNFSTNPTYLNGRDIRGRGPVKLENGSIVGIPGVLEVVFRYS